MEGRVQTSESTGMSVSSMISTVLHVDDVGGLRVLNIYVPVKPSKSQLSARD